MQFEGLISRMYMFFGMRKPNLRSIFKPKVELMVFLRMRRNKITKIGGPREHFSTQLIRILLSGLGSFFFKIRISNVRSVLKRVQLYRACAVYVGLFLLQASSLVSCRSSHVAHTVV